MNGNKRKEVLKKIRTPIPRHLTPETCLYCRSETRTGWKICWVVRERVEPRSTLCNECGLQYIHKRFEHMLSKKSQ
ncbi:expressed protein [Dictyostelium purpureum]|uniref:Expressed protein n=1 Tax=Dictyostelium purpureum TaxID=5786 RepID=F0ZIJ2_DICPU|nr:uncharacterized protein DICPUDRAFT_91875 [Dictyostelium purpureum]EGC36225.1 expressed protein [Dictyostelium purpureum]|eukprot:XP_003287234.1 expressed protein [Dictyostelium purpureum]